jgi:hypothetical protein
MKLLAACLAIGSALGLTLPGCLWASQTSEATTGYAVQAVLGDAPHLEGAAVSALAGYAGVAFEGEAGVHQTDRPDDSQRYRALRVGGSLRFSLFGILASDHRLERYLDLGPFIGGGAGPVFGVPPHGIAAEFTGWAGAWIDIGTLPVGAGYLALTGSVRAETSIEPWHDRTQLAVGLAWRTRAPRGSDLHFHD